MPSLPQPTGPARDPWAEQARRRAAHRARRRRRGWWALLALAGVAAAGFGTWLGLDRPSGRASDAMATPAAPSTSAPAAAPAPAPPPASSTTVAPGSVVRLEEVWLLDRQDGTYDWGLVVESTDDGDREGVTVSGRLVDASGAVAAVVTDEVAVLPAGERVAVGGVVRDLALAPVRLEADVAVGRPAVGPPERGTLAVRAVERRGNGRDGAGEVVAGRVVSTLAGDTGALRLGAIWRDDSGAVVAAAFHDIARVRPGVDARFEIPLDGLIVPAGPPDEVLVAQRPQ